MADKALYMFFLNLLAPLLGLLALIWAGSFLFEWAGTITLEDGILFKLFSMSLALAFIFTILSAPVFLAVQTKATISTWFEYRREIAGSSDRKI